MTIPAGALRFNSDSGKLEVYCGGPVGFGTTTITGAWFQIDSFSPDSATGGARGVFGGGNNPTENTDIIDYVTISTTGNAQDFGDLTESKNQPAACASNTRGIFAVSYTHLRAHET